MTQIQASYLYYCKGLLLVSLILPIIHSQHTAKMMFLNIDQIMSLLCSAPMAFHFIQRKGTINNGLQGFVCCSSHYFPNFISFSIPLDIVFLLPRAQGISSQLSLCTCFSCLEQIFPLSNSLASFRSLFKVFFLDEASPNHPISTCKLCSPFPFHDSFLSLALYPI